MAILGCDRAYLYVWTYNDNFLEVIHFGKNWWKASRKKAVTFYENAVIPTLFDGDLETRITVKVVMNDIFKQLL